jgi:hypothetical protein
MLENMKSFVNGTYAERCSDPLCSTVSLYMLSIIRERKVRYHDDACFRTWSKIPRTRIMTLHAPIASLRNVLLILKQGAVSVT